MNCITISAHDLKLVSSCRQSAERRELLPGRNGVEVTLFGRFKAGKSSFLNQFAERVLEAQAARISAGA